MKKNIVFIVLSYALLIIYFIVYKVIKHIYGEGWLNGYIVPLGGVLSSLFMSLVVLSIRYAFPKRFKVVRVVLLCLVPFFVFCGIMNWVSIM